MKLTWRSILISKMIFNALLVSELRSSNEFTGNDSDLCQLHAILDGSVHMLNS